MHKDRACRREESGIPQASALGTDRLETSVILNLRCPFTLPLLVSCACEFHWYLGTFTNLKETKWGQLVTLGME
jgi:hypothetical protein